MFPDSFIDFLGQATWEGVRAIPLRDGFVGGGILTLLSYLLVAVSVVLLFTKGGTRWAILAASVAMGTVITGGYLGYRGAAQTVAAMGAAVTPADIHGAACNVAWSIGAVGAGVLFVLLAAGLIELVSSRR